VNGQQATGFIMGELWITYDLLLLKPRMPPASVLDTWDAPPSIGVLDPSIDYNHHAEVPLTAVLPESSADYPSELKDVD